jgi:hypothetical protein
VILVSENQIGGRQIGYAGSNAESGCGGNRASSWINRNGLKTVLRTYWAAKRTVSHNKVLKSKLAVT